MDLSTTNTAYAASTVVAGTPGLTQNAAQAHAACMWTAFAVIFPLGIIIARYFKDIGRRWYLVHAVVQAAGVIIALGGFILALHRFGNQHTHHHFAIGVAAMGLVLMQPFTAIPRLCLHHGQVLRNPFFAWLHWTFGRGAVVFGWVNIFFGFGEYRKNFALGSWPQVAFGLYLGSLTLLCLVLESRLWNQSAAKQRQREDDLSRRIAALSGRGPKTGHGKAVDSDDDDDLLVGTAPQNGRDLLASDAEGHLQQHVANEPALAPVHGEKAHAEKHHEGITQRVSQPRPKHED